MLITNNGRQVLSVILQLGRRLFRTPTCYKLLHLLKLILGHSIVIFMSPLLKFSQEMHIYTSVFHIIMKNTVTARLSKKGITTLHTVWYNFQSLHQSHSFSIYHIGTNASILNSPTFTRVCHNHFAARIEC